MHFATLLLYLFSKKVKTVQWPIFYGYETKLLNTRKNVIIRFLTSQDKNEKVSK